MAGISTKELDKLADISPGHTWVIESAKGGTEAKTLDKVAGVLGLSLDYLVRGKSPRPTARAVRKSVEKARLDYAKRNKTPSGTPEAPTGTSG